MNDIVKANDTLIHLGDVAMDLDGIKLLDKLVVKNKILIVGNYDIQFQTELSKYFKTITNDAKMTIGDIKCYLNHYPTNHKEKYFNIVGYVFMVLFT